MFRKLIVTALLFWSFQPAPKSIYDFVVPGLKGEKLRVATKGKKLLVIVFGSNAHNTARLRMIDSLQAGEPVAFQVLAVPVLDFDGQSSVSDIRKLVHQVQPSFPIAKPVAFANGEDEAQHKLLQWLTRKDHNRHFEQELQDGQMFLVNEFGVLFATMGAATPPQSIKQLLGIQLKL